MVFSKLFKITKTLGSGSRGERDLDDEAPKSKPSLHTGASIEINITGLKNLPSSSQWKYAFEVIAYNFIQESDFIQPFDNGSLKYDQPCILNLKYGDSTVIINVKRSSVDESFKELIGFVSVQTNSAQQDSNQQYTHSFDKWMTLEDVVASLKESKPMIHLSWQYKS